MVSRSLYILPLFAVALAIGCAAAIVVKEEPVKPAVSAHDSLKIRFEGAYFELGCMANEGIDPLMTMRPLRKPYDYLDGLVESESLKLETVKRLLNGHGFTSIERYRLAEKRFRSNRSYWQTIETRFVDELLKCK